MANDNLETVVKKVAEKLDKPVQKLIADQYDEHDILPGTMWVLLEHGKRVEPSIQSLSRSIAEQVSGLKQQLFDELGKGNQKIVTDVTARLDKVVGSVESKAMEMQRRIGELSTNLTEANERILQAVKGVQGSANDLAELVRTLNTDAKSRANAVRDALEHVRHDVSIAMDRIITEIATKQTELSISFGNQMKRLWTIIIVQGVTVILVLAAVVLLR